MQTVRSFVGMDVHKATISISVAEDGRNGPVRFLGVIPNTPDDIAKMAKRLAKHGELDFCYEASGCGYGIHRQLTALGPQVHRGRAVDDSAQAGERIKTDRRDSREAGDPAPIRRPDAGLGSRHHARSASRSGPSESGCIHAPDAGPPAVARLPACVMAAAIRPASTGRSAIAAGLQVRRFRSRFMASSSRIIWRRCGPHRREEMP